MDETWKTACGNLIAPYEIVKPYTTIDKTGLRLFKSRERLFELESRPFM